MLPWKPKLCRHLKRYIKPLMKREHPRNAWNFAHLEKLCKKQSKPAFVSYHNIFGKNQYITDVVVFSFLFFSVFDKFNFSSTRAAIGEKYLQTFFGGSNFWPKYRINNSTHKCCFLSKSVCLIFFFWNDSLSPLNIHTTGPEIADLWMHAKTYGWASMIRPIFLTI